MNQLEPNRRDRLVSVVKAAAGALPYIGTSVGEILDSVVPNLRFERVINYLKNLEAEVIRIDERMASFEKHIKTEEGLDIRRGYDPGIEVHF